MNLAIAAVSSAVVLAVLLWFWLKYLRLPRKSQVLPGLNRWNTLMVSEFMKPADMSQTKRELEAMEASERADLEASTAFRKRLLNAGHNAEMQQHVEHPVSDDPDEQEVIDQTARRRGRR